jgi:RNA polymerase sigma factor (sigma-70 family)
VELSGAELQALRRKLRFKVCHRIGFACPDVDDIVQESLARFLRAAQAGKMQNVETAGAFLNGIAQNVILEYRRRWNRDGVISDTLPEPVDKRSGHSEVFELHDAIIAGLHQLSTRDREILQAFYFDENSKDEILARMNLTDEAFRVILCRAKERFRRIYNGPLKQRAVASHN